MVSLMNQRIPIVGSKTWLTHPYFYDFTFIFFVFWVVVCHMTPWGSQRGNHCFTLALLSLAGVDLDLQESVFEKKLFRILKADTVESAFRRFRMIYIHYPMIIPFYVVQ